MSATGNHSIDDCARERRKQASKAVGRVLRFGLYYTGIVLYHCALAGWIIKLSPRRVRTLLYHSVETKPGPYTANLNVNVTPETFERHLAYFSSYYNVASVSDIAAGKTDDRPLAITFDDGYSSVESHAVPLLERYGLSATVYLIGAAVQGDIVWVNRLNHALNAHPRLTSRILASYPTLATLSGQAVVKCVQQEFSPSDIEHLMSRLASDIPSPQDSTRLFSDEVDILAMQARNITFGFHTSNHYNLERCNEEQLDKELDCSAIAHLLNSNTFAYPFGYFDSRATRRLEQQGYARLLTVAKAAPDSSFLHTARSETFETTAAGVFAQIEIVEPVFALLRTLCSASRKRIKLALNDHVHSDYAEENGMPETSKPR